MGFAFNPFTGNFDAKGSGGGGGASYIDGEVQNFSALPETIGSPAVDSAYLVREAEGTWLLNRKPAGIYVRTANTGTRASDWTYAGEFPDVFSDANFVLYDNGDSTKNLQFQLSGITTGTTRTITAPDANITLDDAGDSRTPTSHASSHAAAGSDPVFDQNLNTTDNAEFAQVGFGGDFTIDATGLNWGGQLIFEPETNTFYDQAGNTAFAVGSTCEFLKDVILLNTADTSASVELNADAITTGQSRVISFPDASGTLALVGDAPASHTHGNLTNDGKVGSTSGLPLKTGTAGVVEAGAFGGGAGEFAEGNHTHAQLHDKSHTMTDATSHTAGNHKVFYSDGTGSIVELALGNSGEVLTSNGATSAPSFAAASGGDTVTINASAADVLSVSSGEISAVDATADKIVFWDDSASELTYLATVGPTFDGTTLRWPVELVIACSDESTSLTTGTAKVTFRAPYAFTLTGVRASVNTAPTGSTLIVDINNGANSALSTKLSIDASEKTSTTAATTAVIDTTYDDFSDDAEITIDIDQIGSTIAGKGLKVTLIGTRA